DLARAHALNAAASFDQAAVVFDEALERGAAQPHRLLDTRSFVSAHIARANLALARGESQRAEVLITRVLRYDPSVLLLPDEDRPRLHNLFEQVRKRLGPRPTLDASDLAGPCKAGPVVLVARRVEAGIEFTRFDECRLVAQAVSNGDAEPISFAALLQTKSAVAATAAHSETAARQKQ